MSKAQPPYLGSAYYPEAWPLEQVDEDIALMKKAGMNCARIGEFAWSRMEPRESRYDFAWMHKVVEKLDAAGLAVILGTPSCTPPMWLTEAHPQILAVHPDGTPTGHGARRHACPNNPLYREHCAKIVTRMAQEFGREEAVIGWQIDNELYSAFGWWNLYCSCGVCLRKFQEGLRKQFKSVEALNEAWGLNLWSMAYGSFEQIPVMRPDIWHHPSLKQAWSEFNSNSYAEFAAHQTELLKRLVRQPVGTDMMPADGVDYHDIHKPLDLVQFNHYDAMDGLPRATFWMGLCKNIKDRPWWNTETATCWNGSVTANGYKEPGFCRANSWLPLALGGEANLYWLWRQHATGQELMHGAVLSSQGRPLHIFEEVQEIGRGFAKAGDFLRGSTVTPSALALHYSHRAAWLFRHQAMVNKFDYSHNLIEKVYKPLLQSQMRPEILLPPADLKNVKVLLSPFLPMLDEAGLRERLKAWIQAGGIWIAGPLTDNRNLHAGKFSKSPYGSLEEWGGVYCKYEIPGDPRDFKLRWVKGKDSQGSVWYDGLEPKGAETLASYSEGPCAGLAAATRQHLGKGQVILLGTLPQPQDLLRLVHEAAQAAEVKPSPEASENLLFVPRQGPAGRGALVVEMENKPGGLNLPEPAEDLLTGRHLRGKVRVDPFDVMVLRFRD